MLVGNLRKKRIEYEGPVLSIEIESEFKNAILVYPDEVSRTFEMKGDGSLRNYGYEFISRRPMLYDDPEFNKGLDLLIGKIIRNKKLGFIPNNPRTSTHVHINAQDLTLTQLWTIVLGYWFFEPLITRYCDPRRYDHLYCHLFKSTTAISKNIEQHLINPRNHRFKNFSQDYFKYGGLNISALFKFGTFEIRNLEGIESTDKLIPWLRMCNDTRVGFIKQGNPAKLFNRIFLGKNECEKILFEIYDREFIELLIKNNPDWHKECSAGLRALIPLAYQYTDWEKWEAELEIPKAKVFADYQVAIHDEVANNIAENVWMR